ncbi:helix-turn-helix domain-containing protein [Bacillus horti]|uniref:DNA-binding transcriptional ArsR family regulator n=1 Tax=Caldalkalibacillus horti TaxID=77523 RepID=A0ABT9VXU3_9BACI|nr:helix-turn-helix domain-containing protein [Bacillus horti]MDQ0165632.1 DNA-binding transcriptional ArsR family regulator [Bacillus horti]
MAKKADMLLHPIRMRIIQALLLENALTVAQLVIKLGNVPQATIYRHINLLLEAQMIEVTDTKRVQGTVERYFSVAKENLSIPEAEMRAASQEDTLRYLTAFHTSLLQQAEDYIMHTPAENYEKDGFGFWQIPLHLTEDQYQQFSVRFKELLQDFEGHEAGPGTKSRLFSGMFIPQKDS